MPSARRSTKGEKRSASNVDAATYNCSECCSLFGLLSSAQSVVETCFTESFSVFGCPLPTCAYLHVCPGGKHLECLQRNFDK